jgi:hypothetical protein
LEDGLFVPKPPPFPTNQSPKTAGPLPFTTKDGLGSFKQVLKRACEALWWTFHQIKVRQQIGRKDSISHHQKNAGIKGIFALSSKEL